MKKSMFNLLLCAIIAISFTACAKPTDDSSKDDGVPILHKVIFSDISDEEISKLQNYDSLTPVTDLKIDTNYKLVLTFTDSDLDVCEQQISKSKDFPDDVKCKMTQIYVTQSSAYGFVFDESDVSNEKMSFYVRLKDSKGNYSNTFEIKDLTISK